MDVKDREVANRRAGRFVETNCSSISSLSCESFFEFQVHFIDSRLGALKYLKLLCTPLRTKVIDKV